MEFTHEVELLPGTSTVQYCRAGSHEEGDFLKEIWRFVDGERVCILVAQEGYQTHYFSNDPKTEERGRSFNGYPMTAVVRPR